MTGIDALAGFLLARIAEDEDVVRWCLEAVDADRTEYARQLARRTAPYSTVTSSSHCGQDMGPRGTVEATPGRILAECAAKRRIVDEAEAASDPGDRRGDGLWTAMLCLALPYAYHPDYHPKWCP